MDLHYQEYLVSLKNLTVVYRTHGSKGVFHFSIQLKKVDFPFRSWFIEREGSPTDFIVMKPNYEIYGEYCFRAS